MSSGGAAAVGLAWAAVLAAPLVVRARRDAIRGRAGALRRSPGGRRRDRALGAVARHPAVRATVAPAAVIVQRRAARRRDALVGRELPVVVDLLAVAVGAGATPYVALETAAAWAPPIIAARLREVMAACELGAGFANALDAVAVAEPRLCPLADALVASDRYGTAIGSALSRLAIEQRAVIRREAEARARTVPVRLLFPLVFLVLPAFGLLTVVPALLTGLGRT